MELADRIREAVADRYAVEGELGRGGMAVVFLARDLQHDRRVAIKVLRPELSVSLVADRFLREIQIAAQLQHPLIVPLFESGGTGELLWYVMPFVEGETLRQRLLRERQLPLEDALRITQDAAAALQCAHEHGFVHRDVKPENILLSGGRAVIMDFGIARALTRAAGQGTSSGVAIGTPAYMSPEQASGSPRIDARTDVYSLGCVLYEMLVGEPPFTGATPQAVIARQVSQTPPQVRVVRPGVPEGIEAAVARALAKSPADRFPTPTDFASAVADARASVAPTPWPSWRWMVGVAGLVMAVVAGVWFAGVGGRGGEGVAADTSRYVVLPFEYGANVAQQLGELELLHDALARWSGLSVADPFQVREALASTGAGPMTYSKAAKVALRVGAGRYLRGSVSRLGDSLRVQAGLYDAAGDGSPLAVAAVRVGPSLSGLDSLFAGVVDRLLFRGSLPEGAPALVGTRSLPARQAFAGGQRALETWDLELADSAFSAAVQLDPTYAQAHLWVALVRAWNGADPARWRIAAEQATLHKERLSTRDRGMADAVLREARGDAERGCSAWERLTERNPRDFAGWYGAANCQRSDRIVIPDASSPSGWRFRSSYHHALAAYRRAFELHPSILRSFRTGSYEGLRKLLFTSGNTRRPGFRPAPDTARFFADPAWQGDSLAFVPYPRSARAIAALTATPGSHAEAVRRERLLFRDIAETWVASFPQDADAILALSISMGMLGDPAALDSLRRARSLAEGSREALEVAGAEVWTLLRLGIPLHREWLGRARAVADSLIAAHQPGTTDAAQLLASLAALTGRAVLAAAYNREATAGGELETPPALRATGPALLVYAALGGPADSLVRLESLVHSAANTLPPSERPAAEARWLARPATLAFDTYRFTSLANLAGRGYYPLVDLQAAWVRDDTAAVRRGLREMRDAQQQVAPADIALDALYPAVKLLDAAGDPQGAASWLEPTLRTLAQGGPNALSDPVPAAALVRAMAFRATLARRLGDPEGARQWAAAVEILWSGADPFLGPIVREMRRLERP